VGDATTLYLSPQNHKKIPSIKNQLKIYSKERLIRASFAFTKIYALNVDGTRV
jgi:hypothetical protein